MVPLCSLALPALCSTSSHIQLAVMANLGNTRLIQIAVSSSTHTWTDVLSCIKRR